MPISWLEEAVPSGHKMTFKESIHIVSQYLIMRSAVPKIILNLIPRFRKIYKAFNELEVRRPSLLLCLVLRTDICLLDVW